MGLFRKEVGRKGEEEAAGFLKKNGYKILEKNYRCRYGEIDIIASDKGTIVFVEVKTRGSEDYGAPGASVDLRKQKHMTIASSVYLCEKGLADADSRFDVVSVMYKGSDFKIELIKDAFEASEIG